MLSDFCAGGKYGQANILYPFDDVLLKGSIGAEQDLGTLAENEKKQAESTLTMPTKSVLKKAIVKDKVAVVAYVLGEKGNVENAAKFYMPVDGKATGITQTTAAANTVKARYNAAGQQVKGEVKGLNIVKMADGTTVKYVK